MELAWTHSFDNQHDITDGKRIEVDRERSMGA